MHVKAVEVMLKRDGELPFDVLFLIEGEEESGGDTLAPLRREAKAEI